MKNIVLKVPTAIFLVVVLMPFLVLVLQMVANRELMDIRYYSILGMVSFVVSSIWLFSIVDYFQSKISDFKYTNLIYILLGADVIIGLLISFEVPYNLGINSYLPVILRASVVIAAIVFITLLVRKVFYERAVWFIVLEILIVIVGITTLTPEIKRNEQEA